MIENNETMAGMPPNNDRSRIFLMFIMLFKTLIFLGVAVIFVYVLNFFLITYIPLIPLMYMNLWQIFIYFIVFASGSKLAERVCL